MFSLYLKVLVFLPLGIAWAFPFPGPQGSNNRAVYFQDNDPAGNSIVSLKISDDGTLSSPVRTSTGGIGLSGLAAPSQDAVVVSENYLFTVNAGSNTLSMFLIDPEDPWHPQLVGTPVATLGETPITAAYSSELRTACVANAGAVAGVTCYSVDSVKGLTALGPTRFVPQTEDTDPTAPPVGPLVLISDIIFNPSSTALLITVRSNGAQPGLIYAWPVVDGQVSTNAVVSSFADLALIFSLDFLGSDDRMVATNPHLNTPGAAYLDISYPSLEITVERIVTIPDQEASCWIVLVPQYDDIIVVDALRPNITVISPETGAVKGVFHFDAPPPGAADSKLDRSWLYTLTDSATAPQVLVFDITPLGSGGLPLLVQSYDIASALGPIPTGAGDFGLAIYPSY